MTYFLALIAGIAGAIAGYAASGSLAAVIARAMGMSSFEGAIGYFAFLGVGPIGGLIGLVAGIWIVLRRRGGFRAGALAGRGLVVFLGIVVLAAGTLAYLYFQRDIISSNSLPPELVFEIRLPPGAAAPAKASDIRIDLNTDKNTMPATLASQATRSENGRTVIAGAVDLYYRTSQRMLVLRLPNEPTRLFTLRLRATPSPSDNFGEWHKVDLIDDATSAQPRKAGANEGHEVRYRVEDRTRMRMVGIDFEIRLPEGTPLPPERSGIRIVLRTDDQEYEGNFLAYDWKRADGARTVLVGGMGIPDPRAHPRVLLALPGGPTRVFTVTLPAAGKFGQWLPAEAVEEPGQPPRPPRSDEAFEFRYSAGR